MLYIDQTNLSDGAKTLVRWSFTAPAILMPAGFGLSVASPSSQRPNRFILLAWLGAAVLAAGVLTLGFSLL